MINELQTTALGCISAVERPRYVAFWQILLQKSKIERRQKSRESRFLDSSIAATLCIADARVRGRFVGKNEEPHIALYERHQQS
jgi:hypothetical protein